MLMWILFQCTLRSVNGILSKFNCHDSQFITSFMSECSGTGKMRTIALHDSCVTLNPLEVSKEYTNRELLRQIPDNVIKIPVPKQRNCRN